MTRYWFLALNGSSVAACNFPTSEFVEVVPRPEVLIGYLSQKRQLAMQRNLLTCDEDKLTYWFSEVGIDRICGDCIVKRLSDAEPQTDGPTLWVDPPSDEIAELTKETNLKRMAAAEKAQDDAMLAAWQEYLETTWTGMSLPKPFEESARRIFCAGFDEGVEYEFTRKEET